MAQSHYRRMLRSMKTQKTPCFFGFSCLPELLPSGSSVRTVVLLAVVSGWTCGVTAAPPGGAPDGLPKLEIPLPTLGGKQFWTDYLFLHQWRIQRSAVTGQFRLLDPNNLQHAAGGYVECRAKLEEIKHGRNLPPMNGKAVILLHGLVRTRSSMGKLAKHLQQQGEYQVLNMSYASTQHEVARHAKALHSIVRQLDDVEEINFVGHSLGNIVVRHYLYDQMHREDGRPPDKRIKRFVMIAPPNHGSLLAATVAEIGAYKTVTGKAGRELGQQWARLEGKLATPPCQFGIIAGGLGNDAGFNPLLEGDDDGTVSVASTRLAGATDFVLVPALHSFITSDSKVLDYTLRFLQKGYFVSADKQQPVRKDEGSR